MRCAACFIVRNLPSQEAHYVVKGYSVCVAHVDAPLHPDWREWEASAALEAPQIVR